MFIISKFLNIYIQGFTYPEALPDPESSFTRSLFWPNEATFHGHPRFRTLTGNIRQRRGEKVIINIFSFSSENRITYFQFVEIHYEQHYTLIIGLHKCACIYG